MEHIRILLLGVSFRVYISYKIRTRQKSEKDWKSGNGRNVWSPQRVHFSDWFFQKVVLDHASPQMYQSRRTLRLRREMSLPLTFIRPFRDNPQSCPLVYQRVPKYPEVHSSITILTMGLWAVLIIYPIFHPVTFPMFLMGKTRTPFSQWPFQEPKYGLIWYSTSILGSWISHGFSAGIFIAMA